MIFQLDDYVEATVFSKDEAVIMVGNFVDKPAISNVKEWRKVIPTHETFRNFISNVFKCLADKQCSLVVQTLVLQACGNVPYFWSRRRIHSTERLFAEAQ